MENSLKFKIADLLYKRFYALYKPLYFRFKEKQDAEELKLIKKFVKQGNTIIDIGANIGFYCRHLSSYTGPKGKVFAFEPDRLNFKRLVQNTKELKNVEVHNKAVGAKTETLTLYASPLLNVDHRTFPIEGATESYQVEAVCIDDFVNDKFPVDFIKMDIQGFEYFALQGMKNTIQNNPNLKLLMELSPVAMQKAGISLDKLFEWIREMHLLVYFIEGHELRPINETVINKVRSYTSELEFENIILSVQPI